MISTTRRSLLLSTAALTASGLFPLRWMREDKLPGARAKLPDSDRFLDAVRRGEEAAVARMLDARPELLGCGDEHGRSALIVALLCGHDGLAPLFVSRGYVLDAVEAGLVPDWERLEKIAAETPEQLNEAHVFGGPVLYAATRLNRPQLWRYQALGADPNASPLGPNGHTASYAAVELEDEIDAMGASVALFSNGADVNAPQRGGDSILHAAVRRNEPYLVRYFLRRGARVEARNAAGETPLEQARRLELPAMVTLLENHASVPRDCYTARYAFDANGAPVEILDLADVPQSVQSHVTGSSHGDLEAVRAALTEDPRLVFSFSTQDELAIEACGHTGARDIIRLHLDHGAPQSVTTSVSLGDLARARTLIEDDPQRIHERGPHDFPLMWYASIGGGSVAAAEMLLELGVPIDQESQHTTTLHRAASRGQLDLARYLVERGCDKDAVGYPFEGEPRTAREVALERGHEDVAKMLKELGAA